MSAREELDAARAVVAHMDLSRGPDNARADLIAVWNAVEAALRSLVGGSTNTGQALIRDARARQLLSFEQANALVSLLAVREQADRPDYIATDTDINTARAAFLKLDAGLMTAAAAPQQTSGYGPPAGRAPQAPSYAAVPAATGASASPTVPPAAGLEPVKRKRRPWVLIIVAVIVAPPIAFLIWRNNGDDPLVAGIRAYQAGQKDVAAMNLERAARAMPDKALPHVYLARMAREVGNYTVANQELQLALKAEPLSLDGRREYGSFFLSQGNYDQARVWYLHALETDANDLPSQGWLGCALIKLGRGDEGMRWLNRAGNGGWSTCRNAAAPAAPGQIRP